MNWAEYTAIVHESELLREEENRTFALSAFILANSNRDEKKQPSPFALSDFAPTPRHDYYTKDDVESDQGESKGFDEDEFRALLYLEGELLAFKKTNEEDVNRLIEKGYLPKDIKEKHLKEHGRG
ncbi:hypothetical protein [Flammeovirga sp. OC4]|uniref:hypothetical protein n=1 Tax=Flammeovirga sp. OC4 TaxID=1382345 RepID=UPI0005C44336|nr:hypothetical protein [Flammeovirga sp. OC4]